LIPRQLDLAADMGDHLLEALDDAPPDITQFLALSRPLTRGAFLYGCAHYPGYTETSVSMSNIWQAAA
jgi:hypothetical protein